MISQNRIFTIGHSNYEEDFFIKLLKDHTIDVVADVRQSPYSKYVPQFNRENIRSTLHGNNVKYVFLGDLLGARPKDFGCYTDNKVDFAKIAKAPFFKEGLKRVMIGMKTMKIALMCAEKDPILCHRNILVCKNLKPYSIEILHILHDSTIEENAVTERRLLDAHKLYQTELFRSQEQILDDAYMRQAQKMAAEYNDDDHWHNFL